MNISEIDKNFTVNSAIERNDIVWLDACEYPFIQYGLLPYDGVQYRRIPKEIAYSISDSVGYLSAQTAGGRIRFATDSEFIAIKCDLPEVTCMAHMALDGSSGFDLYCDRDDGRSDYVCTFIAPYDMKRGYDSIYNMNPYNRSLNGKIASYTLNFPLYNAVEHLYIGLKKGSVIDSGKNYRDFLPVAYYGSSITQGACATHPGNSYEAIISRSLGLDYYNFGFSGSCKGESAAAEYLSGVNASIFVCDYDHNAAEPRELKATHYELYRKYRSVHPDTPYIMVTRTDCLCIPEEKVAQFREAVRDSYRKAKQAGDKNVYFIDGGEIFNVQDVGVCLSDGVHPTDMGFYLMAKTIGGKIAEILGLNVII